MIIKMLEKATSEECQKVKELLLKKNFQVKDISGDTCCVFGVVGDTSSVDTNDIYALSGVSNVTRIQVPFKKASRTFKHEDTIVNVGDAKIGEGTFTVIAGPCSVESKEQIVGIAKDVKASGALLLRGGAFKPRTSPYSFQGLELEGLELLKEARKETGLPIVTEIMSVDLIDTFVKDVDVIQVGARNMQNFALLKALGKINKPVLLKRGLSATIEEWLMSAEYIMAGGNENVILCERGIRTFEKYTRNTLDLSAVLAVKELSHLPVIVDPSHSAGKWQMVEKLSLAAAAVGADGIIVEVHNDPEHALCDGNQSIKPKKFAEMMAKIEAITDVLGKKLR